MNWALRNFFTEKSNIERQLKPPIYPHAPFAANLVILDVKDFLPSANCSCTCHDTATLPSFNADDPYEENDIASDPAYADTITDLKQRLINKINNEYVPPPDTYYETRSPVLEPNPADASQVAWGIGFCDDLDLLMPTK